MNIDDYGVVEWYIDGRVVHWSFTGDEFDSDAPGVISITYEAE